MDLLMFGLGRMGANMAERLLLGGHRIIAYDPNPAAVEQEVAAPVITLSLFERYRSRDSNSFSDRLLAVMRQRFGGHAVKTEKGS
jgi:6-phosphogluconate dehydrogenase (decarboxylating)